MPVSYIPSAEQMVQRQKTTARKRRRNQNTEIEELSALLPFPTATNAKLGIDKISVLRLATTYLRFQTFLESVYGEKVDSRSDGYSELLAKAIDGFLLVLDGQGNVLYTSETITEYVGLSQQDVIGQSLYDLTQPDDAKSIAENLEPKGTRPSQFRQFYVRFKSTVSPGRMQLSRFTSHIMVQVSGNLKLQSPTKDLRAPPTVIGLVAECRLIESSSSVLELSIPQSSFTSTMSLECTILSVDTKVKSVIGFDAEDFVGTHFEDYFHPADYAQMIPCRTLLKRTGHAVSPIFRFMTHTGEWVWVQLDGLVRFKEGTTEPQYVEVKCKVVSAYRGKARMIEQKELYAASRGPIDPAELKNPHRDAYFLDQLPKRQCCQTADPILEGLKGVSVSNAAIDTILHSRELGLQQLPECLKMLQPPPKMEEEWQRMQAYGFPDPASHPSPQDSSTSSLSPSSASSPPSISQPSPQAIHTHLPSAHSFSAPNTPRSNISPQVSQLSSTASAFGGHTSLGSVSSVSTDYYTGGSIVSPPSALSVSSEQPNLSVQSPPSVFSGAPSPDSGILSAHGSSSSGVLSPPSSFTSNSPQGSGIELLSPGTPPSSHELDTHVTDVFLLESAQSHQLPHAARNGVYTAADNAGVHQITQTSIPQSFVPQNSVPQQRQQQQAFWPSQNQPFPQSFAQPADTASTNNGISDAELEQLLFEVVALNDYSAAPFAAESVTPTITSGDLSNIDPTFVPLTSGANASLNPYPFTTSTASNQFKVQSTCDTLADTQLAMLGNVSVYNGFTATTTVATDNGHTQAQNSSEVQEILQQLM